MTRERRSASSAVRLILAVGLALCAATAPSLGQVANGVVGNGCSGNRPQYTDPLFAPFSGKLLAMTAVRYDSGASGASPALTLFNLRDDANAVLGTAGWEPTGLSTSAPFRYSGPPLNQWTQARLGTLFGVTLDNTGNIYVAHSAVYTSSGYGGLNEVGSVGGGNGIIDNDGVVYKVSTGSGIPSVFAKLPNGIDATTHHGPGLGNLNFDTINNQLFVSDFEDGRIYRLNGTTGGYLSAFDHSTNTITPFGGGVLTLKQPRTGKHVALGSRVWAVQRNLGRLYYSVYNGDGSGGIGPNEIWSVALDGAGEFMSSTRRLEVTIGTFPIADISFAANGKMLVSERTMWGPLYSAAHNSQLYEFELNSSNVWVLSAANTNLGTSMYAGGIFSYTNTAGGCDYDYASGNRAWFTGDALNGATTLYGFGGDLRSGGTIANSIFGAYFPGGVGAKTQMGDLEITCPPPCTEISNDRLACETTAAPGNFSYWATVTNRSGSTVSKIVVTAILGGTVVANNNINVTLANNASANIGPVSITGPAAGGPMTLVITLLDSSMRTCCTITRNIVLPHCDCLAVTGPVVCDPTTGTYVWTPTISNLTSINKNWVTLNAPGNVGLSSTLIALTPPLAPGASRTLAPISISGVGAVSNARICITAVTHDALFRHACANDICITLPPCQVNSYTPFLTAVAHCCTRRSWTASATLRICNPTNATGTYTWGLTPGAGAGCTGPVPAWALSTPSGSVVIAPHQCANIPLTFNCEFGVEGGRYCYNALISGPGVLTTISAQVMHDRSDCINDVDPWNNRYLLSFSQATTATFPLTNVGDVDQDLAYWLGTDSGALSIDGEPGPTMVPYFVHIAAGQTADLSARIAALMDLGEGSADVTLYLDTDGDGLPDPYATTSYHGGGIDSGGTPCIADFNGDGGVDGADVQIFFDRWSEGDPAADANLDGGVDGADVDAFMVAWSAGGC